MELSRRSFIAGTAAVAAAVTAPGLAFGQSLAPFRIRLDWKPWGIHSAFHLAKVKGWYKSVGLDVNIEDGNGSVSTVQMIGANDDFDIGHASLSVMALARHKGLPVKAVAEFMRKNDLALLVPVDSPMNKPADVRGKKLLYTAGSLESPFLDNFLAAGGLTRDDVDLISVDAASKTSTFAVGRADGVFTAAADTGSALSTQRPVKPILFSDFGLPLPGFGLAVSESKLAARKDAIQKFASVTARTWEYIYAGHIDEAVEATLAERPQAKLDPKIVRLQIDTLRTYFEVDNKSPRFGVPVPSNWVKAVKTLTDAKLLPANTDPTSFYVLGICDPKTYDDLIKA